MSEPTPEGVGDALDWLHEQGKRRSEAVPEFDVEDTILTVRIEGELRATGQRQKHPPRSASAGDHGPALASRANYTWVATGERRLAKAALINTRVPNAARVVDFLYGGHNNFEADRKAARVAGRGRAGDSGHPARRARVPAARAALPGRRGGNQAVPRHRHRTASRGRHPRGRAVSRARVPHRVRGQRPDGAGARPGDDDSPRPAAPSALSTRTSAILPTIVAGAGATLDFSLPVAVLLLFTLSYVEDAAEAAAVVSSAGGGGAVRQLCRDLPSGERPGPGAGGGGQAVEQDDARPAHHAAHCAPRSPASWPASSRSRPAWSPSPTGAPPATIPAFERAVPVHGIVARKP